MIYLSEAERERQRCAEGTRIWTLCEADVLAEKDGYWFDEEAGEFVVDWIEEHCVLYEGEWAGEALVCHDWQYMATMRIFGWKRWSQRWQRPVRRFRRGSVWAPKKSKKSPTLAAWGNYLLFGDGEQGQHVYFGAKNGSQARQIAVKHAVEMVLASPTLRHYGKINRTHMSIGFEQTRSDLRPLSSDNVRSQKAQEGLNGCLLVDEVHVVDWDFIERVDRAGISRSEPLHLEVSTVGDEPESYGKAQYDYGKEIEAGRRIDHQFFFVTYEAPQDLTDAELDRDPIKYGKMANPAWGHTIDPEEFLADYQASKVSQRRLAKFKMYRLNIWQRSSTPWLSSVAWEKCVQPFSEEDLKGRWCTMGLDLSRGMDMTALAAVFPEIELDDFLNRLEEFAAEESEAEESETGASETGESEGPVDRRRHAVPEDIDCKLLVWSWLPEGTIDKHAHEIPYREWVAHGCLRMQENTDITLYNLIERDIAELLELFDVLMFAFDAKYATELVQRLIMQHGYDEEKIYPFPQTLMNFCNPTAKMERLVAGQLIHPNENPLLTWQAGHTHVKSDANQNMRPVKPKPGDIRTIDGMVGSIMALDGLTRIEPGSVGIQLL